MNAFPKSRHHDIVVQEFDNEILIYDLSENKAFCLNKTSALVWQACDGSKSIAQIKQIISQKLNSPVGEDFVCFALEQLKKENLIENELPEFFKGISRREAVKKVGLGTIAVLPLVTSLIAPTAANAASTNCTDCVKKDDTCPATCELVLGTCYDNAGCGGGQTISNITCSACELTDFGGGVGTGSWRGN